MRLELSKRTDLALRAMESLNHGSHITSGAELAEAIGTSTNYLPQVMKPLIENKWVAGTPGPGGGYRLRASLRSVSVLDVVEAVEGPTEQGRCVLRGAPCPAQEQCALHTSWIKGRAALLAELGVLSLQEALLVPPGDRPAV